MAVADPARLAAVQPLMFKLRGADRASGTPLGRLLDCHRWLYRVSARRDIMDHGKISVAFGAKQISTGLEPSLNLSEMTHLGHRQLRWLETFRPSALAGMPTLCSSKRIMTRIGRGLRGWWTCGAATSGSSGNRCRRVLAADGPRRDRDAGGAQVSPLRGH